MRDRLGDIVHVLVDGGVDRTAVVVESRIAIAKAEAVGAGAAVEGECGDDQLRAIPLSDEG